MSGLIEKLVLVLAMCIPVVVLLNGVPALIDLTNSTEPRQGQVAAPTPVPQPTLEPSSSGRRFAPVNPTPPPTITAPQRTTPTAEPSPAVAGTPGQPTPTATPSGLRVAIYNTGGIGAAVRGAPTRAAPQVAGLREGQTALVLGRQTVDGTEWINIRTDAGAEGWILGIVGRPTGSAQVVQPNAPPASGQPTRAVPTVASVQAPEQPRATPTRVVLRPTPPPPAPPGVPVEAEPTATPVAEAIGPGMTPVTRPQAPPPAPTGRTHTVQPGDQLKDIAAAHGVSMAAIMAINPIPNPDSLTVGQVLVIPDQP